MRLSKRHQALEERIFEDLEEFGYRYTSGSGNKLGDADVKPTSSHQGELEFSFECKDRPSQRHHGVPAADWKKAKQQILSSGYDPAFVTRNSEGEILVHIQWNDFLLLLNHIYESPTI